MLELMEPLADRLLVRPDEELGEQKVGMLYIPATSQDDQQTGTVLAVGPGTVQEGGEIRPVLLEVGDHVLYGKYAGTSVPIDGEDLLFLFESDIISKIRDPEGGGG